jgi:hypothetical protein
MQISTITLPRTSNLGDQLSVAHAFIRSDLLKHFGGYSEVDVRGAWRDPESGIVYIDKSVRYEIAGAWSQTNRSRLMSLVHQLLAITDQECIMVGWPDGVEFVDRT